MPRFQSLKRSIKSWLQSQIWQPDLALPPEARGQSTVSLVGPLLSCLPQAGQVCQRAAYTLGMLMAQLAKEQPEEARNIMRRLLWHMNEESGNIGWGIPEALGECVAQSEELAQQYHKIVLSYILDLDGDSNFCDHAPLRLSCYIAVERFLAARPDYLPLAKAIIEKAQADPDPLCLEAAQRILTKFYS